MSKDNRLHDALTITCVVVLFLAARSVEYTIPSAFYPKLFIYFGFLLLAYSFGLFVPHALEHVFRPDPEETSTLPAGADTHKVRSRDIESIDTPTSGPAPTVQDTAPHEISDAFTADDTIKESPPMSKAELAHAQTTDMNDRPDSTNPDTDFSDSSDTPETPLDADETTREAEPASYSELKKEATDSE
jgi:hypothetical protein